MAYLIDNTPEIINEFIVCLTLEVRWQQFRRAHGIGDGSQNRQKFNKLLNIQAEQWYAEQQRHAIQVVSH